MGGSISRGTRPRGIAEISEATRARKTQNMNEVDMVRGERSDGTRLYNRIPREQ